MTAHNIISSVEGSLWEGDGDWEMEGEEIEWHLFRP